MGLWIYGPGLLLGAVDLGFRVFMLPGCKTRAEAQWLASVQGLGFRVRNVTFELGCGGNGCVFKQRVMVVIVTRGLLRVVLVMMLPTVA